MLSTVKQSPSAKSQVCLRAPDLQRVPKTLPPKRREVAVPCRSPSSSPPLWCSIERSQGHCQVTPFMVRESIFFVVSPPKPGTYSPVHPCLCQVPPGGLGRTHPRPATHPLILSPLQLLGRALKQLSRHLKIQMFDLRVEDARINPL